MKTLLVSPEVSLTKDRWRLTLSPSAGGRITSLSSMQDRERIDWIVPVPDECRQRGFPATNWPKAGIYPLLPFSNRIRGGRFTSGNVDVRLPLHPGEQHALHGFGHTAEWRLLECDVSRAEMLCTHRQGDCGWPWTFAAKQTITLDAGSLTLVMDITNLSNDALAPMPIGAGFHPYFPRRYAQHMSFDAQQLWKDDAEHVAIGVGDVPSQHDYSAGRRIASDEELTLYFGGWNRQATLCDDQGRRLVMSTSSPLSHLILHAPADRDYFCVEPVTHVADAVNLAQAGFSNTGWRHLPSGHTLTCRLRLDFLDGFTPAVSQQYHGSIT